MIARETSRLQLHNRLAYTRARPTDLIPDRIKLIGKRLRSGRDSEKMAVFPCNSGLAIDISNFLIRGKLIGWQNRMPAFRFHLTPGNRRISIGWMGGHVRRRQSLNYTLELNEAPERSQ